MILVTLGTQKFQMNRLIEAVDKLAPSLGEEVFIQTGNSSYIPQNCKYQDFVDVEDFQQMIKTCSLLITHSGVGSIMTGVSNNRPIIVVPRLEKYHEHVDDHQVQIAEAFEQKGMVLHCKDISDLSDYIQKAKNFQFNPYDVHGGKIEDIVLGFMDIFE